MTAQEPCWERQPGESEASFARFRVFLQLGPDRSLAAVARHFSVSREAVRQQASRHDWDRRAAAWDAAHPPAADPAGGLAVLEPVLARQGDDLEAEHLAELEAFRAEAEKLGKAQFRLARGLNTAAARNAARILASDKPLSPRDICALANASVLLANSGASMWGKSIGVDALMRQMEAAIEAPTVEVLPD